MNQLQFGKRIRGDKTNIEYYKLLELCLADKDKTPPPLNESEEDKKIRLKESHEAELKRLAYVYSVISENPNVVKGLVRQLVKRIRDLEVQVRLKSIERKGFNSTWSAAEGKYL